MICQRCQGLGRVRTQTLPRSMRLDDPNDATETPCPECHGSGIAYCCEGASRGDALAEIFGEMD